MTENQKFTLIGNTKQKLPPHDGLFTRSYQVARAIYDSKIRNWTIEYIDEIFHVTNSDKITETVYTERRIKNCSCHSFLELECGTCLHIEAVTLALLQPHQFICNRIRPIRFVNEDQELQTIGEGDAIDSPAVAPFLNKVKQNNQTFSIDHIVEFDIFKEFGINLFEFQLSSIQKMLTNRRTVLALRMGLGKTLCALACVKLLNKNKIIIVAPNSLKYQWQGEINRFNLGTSLVVAKGGDLKKYTDQRFLIISYEMFNTNKDLLEQTFDIIIADEIQKIKNRESKTWQNVMQLKGEFAFALSGTPIQNNINDLISLIHFLNSEELKPEWKFYEEFCEFSRARIFGIQKSKVTELRERLGRYIINPTIDWTKFKLPIKNEEIIVTSLTPRQIEVHDQYFEPAKLLIAKSMSHALSFPEKMMLNGMLTKARIAATDLRLIVTEKDAEKSEKFDRIEQTIEKVVGAGRKIVIYSEWIKSLNLLVPYLEENRIEYIWFNGTINARNRDKNLKRFIEEPATMVMLSTDTGGQGIDRLQIVCSDLIHLETIWNPMKVEQRNGRLIRAFQKEDVVNVYSFKTNSEIDELIGRNHFRKYAIIDDMLK